MLFLHHILLHYKSNKYSGNENVISCSLRTITSTSTYIFRRVAYVVQCPVCLLFVCMFVCMYVCIVCIIRIFVARGDV